MLEPELSGEFATLMGWADKVRRMKVRANADTPHDARIGAQVRRRGHRALPHRAHVLRGRPHRRRARDDPRRRREGPRARRSPSCCRCSARISSSCSRSCSGLPVTIRLLDPPLHEFLPHTRRGDRRGRRGHGRRRRRSCSARAAELHEFNPMLGFRGCRLAIAFPEIAEMQARAIFEAAVEAGKATGKPVMPEVMVPLVVDQGRARPRQGAHRRHGGGGREGDRRQVDYQVGTMIELPRAALRAGEIAESGRVLLLRHQRPDPDDPRHLAATTPRRFLGIYTAQGHPAGRSVRARSTARASASWCGSAPSAAARRGPTSSSASAASMAAIRPRSRSATSVGLDYVSCSPFRVPIARLAAAQAALGKDAASQA